MNVSDWVQAGVGVALVGVTLALVMITAKYVRLTKKILDLTSRQSKLLLNPVIDIHIGNVGITKPQSSQVLFISADLINVGNAPAIGVLVDTEIIIPMKVSEEVMPTLFGPKRIRLIEVGGERTEFLGDEHVFPSICPERILDRFQECDSASTHSFSSYPRLKIYVYYRNNLGQYFESVCDGELRPETDPDFICSGVTMSSDHLRRSQLNTDPITKEKMDNEISTRNSKRELFEQ